MKIPLYNDGLLGWFDNFGRCWEREKTVESKTMGNGDRRSIQSSVYAATPRRLKMLVNPLKPLPNNGRLMLRIDGAPAVLRAGRGVVPFGFSALLTERSSAEEGSTTDDEEQLEVIDGSSSGVGGEAPCCCGCFCCVGLLELRSAEGARRGGAVLAVELFIEGDFLMYEALPWPLSD